MYDTAGTYTVCLTVANAFNADTLCMEITVTEASGITALFSYIVDTGYVVQFTDESFVDPMEWLWDFGDGQTATEQHPKHIYDTAGVYAICLQVSNGFASDTNCQDIVLTGTTAIRPDLKDSATPIISPNPFSQFIDFTPPEGREIYEIVVTDIQGHTLVHVEMSCPCRIVMEKFEPGVYVYQVSVEGGYIFTGKIVKI
jgi:PKD repeat protein